MSQEAVKPVKECCQCTRSYEVIIGTTYYKREIHDGLQPRCIACEVRYDIDNYISIGFKALRDTLVKDKLPPNLWSMAQYEKLIRPNECNWCGATLTTWSRGGHRLDRVNNEHRHEIDNCVACCQPCNISRGPMISHAWRIYIAIDVKVYGRGKIPWDEKDHRFKRVVIPDLSKHEVKQPQTAILGESSAKRRPKSSKREAPILATRLDDVRLFGWDGRPVAKAVKK